MSQTKTQFVPTPEGREAQKEKVKATLETLVQTITSENCVDNLAKVIIRAEGRPCDTWSLRNRLLMMAQGTSDARTFKAWKSAGRYVKRGSKAIFVVKPYHILVTKKKIVDGKEVEEKFPMLVGFTLQNEFKVEDTDGKPLAYKAADPLPDLKVVVEKWGYTVEFDDTNDHGAYGYHSLQNKKIVLGVRGDFATTTFFHELSHAAFKKIDPESVKLYHSNPENHKKEEMIVQLSSCVLAKLYGIDCEGFTQEYIKNQLATKDLKTVANQISKILDKVDKVVNLILFEREIVVKEELDQ